MTTPDITAIRERAERASTGPWRINTLQNVGQDWLVGTVAIKTGFDGEHADWIVTTDKVHASQMWAGDAKSDAEFIAHSRTDIPDLCDRVEKLEAERALWSTAHLVLSLIAEGYEVKAVGDRYVQVENPNYRPDNGSDPYVVYDCGALDGDD